MTPTRKRVAEMRQRDKDAGLIRVEVKIPASRKAELLEYVAKLILPSHTD